MAKTLIVLVVLLLPMCIARAALKVYVTITQPVAGSDVWVMKDSQVALQAASNIPGTAFTWSADHGSFPNGSSGWQTVWRAGDDFGDVTITCTGTVPGFEPGTASFVVKEIRPDKVRVALRGSYGVHAMPLVTDTVRVRAIVWATYQTQKAYTSEPYASGTTWYTPGSNGPGGSYEPSPILGWPGPVYQWPSTWPPIALTWHKWDHECIGYDDATHNRKYEQAISTNPSGWGLGGTGGGAWGYDGTFNQGSFRVTAIAAAIGDNWVESPSKGSALRISVRTYQDSTLRSQLVSYEFGWREIPYEWGGWWFGGKYSAPTSWVGGADSDDQYGVDCSAFVSAAAYQVGFSWASQRYTVIGLTSHADRIEWSEVAKGDVLIKLTDNGNHIATVYDADDEFVHCIDAHGYELSGTDIHKVGLFYGDRRKSVMESLGYLPWRLRS